MESVSKRGWLSSGHFSTTLNLRIYSVNTLDRDRERVLFCHRGTIVSPRICITASGVDPDATHTGKNSWCVISVWKETDRDRMNSCERGHKQTRGHTQRYIYGERVCMCVHIIVPEAPLR